MQSEFEKKLDEARDIIEKLSGAYDDEISEKNDRIKELEEEVEQLKSDYEELENTNKELQEKIDEFEIETSN